MKINLLYPKPPRLCLISSALAALFLIPILFAPSTLAGEEKQKYYPNEVAVTYGTPTGTVGDVVGQDGQYYSVAEEDVGGVTPLTTTLNPNGPGTNFNWFLGVGPAFPCDAVTHWGCVADGPPSPGDGDVSTVQDSTIGGALDTYSMENYAPLPGFSVDEVRLYGTARNEPIVDGSYALCILSGITLSCDAGRVMTTAYQEFTNTWVLNPDTGLAWTDAEVNALEIGHRWQFGTGAAGAYATLLYVIVQFSSVAVDYTADFTFSFSGFKLTENPRLGIEGLRTGDVETILVQVLRSGVWTTLDADAFDTTLTSNVYSLSNEDIAGSTAQVRIVDSDPTDNTQSTSWIDNCWIETEGDPTPPQHGPIWVYTEAEYLLWENRVKVDVLWVQVGGPEPGVEVARFFYIEIDGEQINGFYQVYENKSVYVGVPWNVVDGGVHKIIVIGYVGIGWSTGNAVYQSEPEHVDVDNLPRAVLIFLALIGIIVAVVIIVVWVVR